MDIYPDFHGPHAGEQRPDAETITWLAPMSRFPCVRVIRHTCECQEVIYELCTSGGLAWVRVTERAKSGPVIRESHPGPYGAAEELWTKFMTGQVR
ncbi:hypothetical protein [Nonomuraea sp. NPDC049028]|uniref:hypothetical protein n=1 Tax=Nonomuraea sp. NPDC049028 TaxID=3364348 RepID=UPI0037102788